MGLSGTRARKKDPANHGNIECNVPEATAPPLCTVRTHSHGQVGDAWPLALFGFCTFSARFNTLHSCQYCTFSSHPQPAVADFANEASNYLHGSQQSPIVRPWPIPVRPCRSFVANRSSVNGLEEPFLWKHPALDNATVLGRLFAFCFLLSMLRAFETKFPKSHSRFRESAWSKRTSTEEVLCIA